VRLGFYISFARVDSPFYPRWLLPHWLVAPLCACYASGVWMGPGPSSFTLGDLKPTSIPLVISSSTVVFPSEWTWEYRCISRVTGPTEKKIFAVLETSREDVTSGGLLAFLWPALPGPRRQSNEPIFWLKLFF